ncbi:dehydrogenase [Intrasporangium chromatireducens Q5-1]|uniref:Dehydrogenase n=1 Tax=Intrasporangium chromatireducens Q5-1 TaxID=584657 RepID=W9GIS8_9MICO|nr:SDR family oxidoreductase [Intrasporangium chromatireducens]EWT06141.1 dehydrogenase [Intrasporangium chromatireducens Q5-1]
MQNRYEGRSVLLTGVAGDIGRTYLHQFVEAGAYVVATDLQDAADTGQSAVDEANSLGTGKAVFVPADITAADDMDKAVRTAADAFGRLDALVNNAAIYQGLGPKRPLTELTEQDWERVLRVNVVGTWQAIRAAAPALRAGGGGRIVNIASVVSRNGAAGFAHYVASKAAVEGLTRAAARELGAAGTTVNAVSPGLVDDTGSRAVNTDEYMERVAATRSIPRAMLPTDLVSAVMWLAGPDSGFVSGQTVIVDGGGVFA